MVVSSQLERPSHQRKPPVVFCRPLTAMGSFSIRNEALHRKRARTLGVRGGSHIARAFLILFLTGSIGTAVAATCEGAHPEELLTYFRGLPASVRQNGIWIVTTHPSSYSESEQAAKGG